MSDGAGLIERYGESAARSVLLLRPVVVTGALPGACYAEGMTAFLSARNIRIFDYPRFAEPLRDAIRERAQELAASAGIQIERIRKEDVVAKVLEKRGSGWQHIRVGGRERSRPLRTFVTVAMLKPMALT